MTQTSARAGDTRRSLLTRSTALGASLAAALALSAQAADIHGISAIAGPPAGFDAVHASDAQLAAFALPPRPDAKQTPDAYAKWVHALSIHTTRLMAAPRVTNIYHGPVRSPSRAAAANTVSNTTVYDSTNWSGAVNTNTLTRYNTTRSFYYIVSDFIVPAVINASCDGTWDYSSQWNGIDGWGSGDVLQAGTEADAYCSSGGTSQYYGAWIEWYPYSESAISLPVSPGDAMFVEVWNTSAYVGYAYVENITTGQVQEYELTPPSGTALIGNSAEWVLERPQVNGSLATLADYAIDYQSNAAAYNFKSTSYLPGSSSSFLVDMTDNYGNLITTTTLLGTSAFESQWR